MYTMTDEDKTALVLQYGKGIIAAIEIILEHLDGLYSDRERYATCMKINRQLYWTNMEVGRIKNPTLFIKYGNIEVNISELLLKIGHR